MDWDQLPSDEAFLEQAFLEVLGRPVDPMGRRYWLEGLKQGWGRDDVVAVLEGSDEHTHRTAAQQLPDLRAQNPDRYSVVPRLDGRRMTVFVADDGDDLAWMEAQIVEHGYYETPGIWSFAVDVDKHVMAEVIHQLEPASVLELGCSSGAVLYVLQSWGVDVAGVEVSRLAVDHAQPTVAHQIHVGELASLPDGPRFDVGAALDVLEHIHPDAVPETVNQLAARAPDGLLVVNSPVFGRDPVFGEVFPMEAASWSDDAAAGRWFHHLPVDPLGYPRHGHLVWASRRWWETCFATAGMRRVRVLERALHHVYSHYWEAASPGRQTLFVLTPATAGMSRRSARELAHRIRQRGSAILADLGEERPEQWAALRRRWQSAVPGPVRGALARARHILAGRRVP